MMPARQADLPMVEISHVTKSYGPKVALHDMSFSVPAGQICGLLGPNGAGKTTLFRLLMGILKATHGTMWIDGYHAFHERVRLKSVIGFLPDDPVFYTYMSGREVLQLSAEMHGLDRKQALDGLMPLIARLRLLEDLDKFAEEYSRGMKKKLGLLLAMLHRPRVLILDEPTNGLDVESTRLFYELMTEEAARGTTVLFSTHLMDHVVRLCSHAVIVNAGQVVATGALDDLRSIDGVTASLEDVFLRLTARPPQA